MPFSATRLRKSDAAAAIVEHVGALAGGLSSSSGPLGPGELVIAEGVPRALEARGFAAVGRATRPDCGRLREVVDAIVADGLPGVLVYLFDETWALGESVRAAISSLLATEYVLAADAWAWSLPPGRGRGWAAHRGIGDVLLDRARPEAINVWVALSDASLDRACMSFVALEDDPGYPTDLARTHAPAARVVPLPVTASTVLAWNANVLHWGGECRPTAPGPRTSCSFTVVRRGAEELIGLPTIEADPPTPDRRVAIVASQIAVYGEGQPDVTEDILAWAKATSAFERGFSASRRP